MQLPLFLSQVEAGFPSPADDWLDKDIDLNDLVQRPGATFLLRARGESMHGAGIHDGGLLIVDRSLTPRHGDIVVAEVLGDMTVKRLDLRGSTQGQPRLLSANPAYPPIDIDDSMDVRIWGVVIHCINSYR